MSDVEAEQQAPANPMETMQQFVQAITATMQALQPGTTQAAAAQAALPQPGQHTVLSDFQRKFGITDKPQWNDYTSYSEELERDNRADRPILAYPGFPLATDRKHRVTKTVFDLHGKAQQHHLRTLLHESHDRMQMQTIFLRILHMLPEEVKALDFGGQKTLEGVMKSLLDTNRDGIARLNKDINDLIWVVVRGEKLETPELPHLTEEEWAEIHLSWPRRRSNDVKPTNDARRTDAAEEPRTSTITTTTAALGEKPVVAEVPPIKAEEPTTSAVGRTPTVGRVKEDSPLRHRPRRTSPND
mmetsp:Transcript_26914/g.67664  ORF Transcript_26914/g.67664 Transcript_26914/m.67664 type:complete len:300 (+) Transcript_26914:87-986(+)